MAKVGEKWVKEVLEEEGYTIKKIGDEDIYGYKDNLGILVEERDYKDPVFVKGNKIIVKGINRKDHDIRKRNIAKYVYNIKKHNIQKNVFKMIVPCFVFSNLKGRFVYPMYFGKHGILFVLNKCFFRGWLKNIEKVYLGAEYQLDNSSMYMGGK